MAVRRGKRGGGWGGKRKPIVVDSLRVRLRRQLRLQLLRRLRLRLQLQLRLRHGSGSGCSYGSGFRHGNCGSSSGSGFRLRLRLQRLRLRQRRSGHSAGTPTSSTWVYDKKHHQDGSHAPVWTMKRARSVHSVVCRQPGCFRPAASSHHRCCHLLSDVVGPAPSFLGIRG